MFDFVLPFVVASALFAYISRRSLLAPHSHGFPRFFAFEALLALILLNAPRWFDEPLSLHQIFSWGLLALSLGIAIHGFLLLRRFGHPDKEAGQGTNIGFENTTELVVNGIYRYIRHPLYLSLMLLGAGAFLKCPSLVAAVLALTVIVFLVATGRIEEDENRRHFGPVYDDYMRRTKMFIPFLA